MSKINNCSRKQRHEKRTKKNISVDIVLLFNQSGIKLFHLFILACGFKNIKINIPVVVRFFLSSLRTIDQAKMFPYIRHPFRQANDSIVNPFLFDRNGVCIRHKRLQNETIFSHSLVMLVNTIHGTYHDAHCTIVLLYAEIIVCNGIISLRHIEQ